MGVQTITKYLVIPNYGVASARRQVNPLDVVPLGQRPLDPLVRGSFVNSLIISGSASTLLLLPALRDMVLRELERVSPTPENDKKAKSRREHAAHYICALPLYTLHLFLAHPFNLVGMCKVLERDNASPVGIRGYISHLCNGTRAGVPLMYRSFPAALAVGLPNCMVTMVLQPIVNRIMRRLLGKVLPEKSNNILVRFVRWFFGGPNFSQHVASLLARTLLFPLVSAGTRHSAAVHLPLRAADGAHYSVPEEARAVCAQGLVATTRYTLQTQGVTGLYNGYCGFLLAWLVDLALLPLTTGVMDAAAKEVQDLVDDLEELKVQAERKRREQVAAARREQAAAAAAARAGDIAAQE